MITVIIAGGSGTRLWPLSTPNYPKHLLKVNGSDRSLLQDTYDRARKISSQTYIVTDASHADHVKDQLPDLSDNNFIIEPARRGTASCIVAALAHVSEECAHDEPIAVLSADHHIRDTEGFMHSFSLAEQSSKESGRIVLVGVEPNYPATGFGYIKKGSLYDEESYVFNVHSFKEKPEYELAQEYVKSGNYLWNCGYFVGSVDTFKNSMKQCAPDLLKNYNELVGTASDSYKDVYLGFENNTIDYALIEKVEELLVVPAAFDWMDLGSYGDLHKAVGSDQRGNYQQGENIELEDVENCYVHNDEARPLAVIGLDNVVVVNTKDGMLVARKDLAQKIGAVSKRINKSK